MNVAVKFNFKFWPIVTVIFIKCWFIWCFFGILLVLSFVIFGYLITIVFFLLVIAVALYNAQDKLLYHPDPENLQSRTVVQTPSIFDLPFENIFIRSLDGTLIHLFLIKQAENIISNCPTIIFFHGNAGNMGHRLHNAAGLYSNVGCNVLMVEYRGYGLSKGSPSEGGLYMDAQSAVDFLIGRPDIDSTQIIVFGRSLGGAVAIDLTSRPEFASKIWCLVVENTFTSIPNMAKALFGWRCLKYLPQAFYKNKYNSLMKINSVTVPTLFISGLNDSLVPPTMMVDLYRSCGSAEKQLIQMRHGSHNDTWTLPGYYANIVSFLQSAQGARPSPSSVVQPTSVVTDI